MATKIRLQRHGRKSYAFYQIVVADSRAPRDGKFIERIGSYNPNTNPATVDLNFERALYWLQVGAQPTDTTRNILSREGVCLKKHLLEGVKKGAFDEATAETKFQAWLKNKQASVQAVKDKDSEAAKAAAIARLEAEKEANKIASNTPIDYSYTGELSGNTAKDAMTLLENPDKIVADSSAHDAAQRNANGYTRKYNEKFEQVCILIPIVAVYFIILIIIRKKTDWFGVHVKSQ